MIERPKQDWGPIHLAKCFGELTLMWIQEVAMMGDDAIVELPDE